MTAAHCFDFKDGWLDHAHLTTLEVLTPQTKAPLGGYKQSGNDREYADWGMHEFLETKGIVGFGEV